MIKQALIKLIGNANSNLFFVIKLIKQVNNKIQESDINKYIRLL